MEVIHISNNFDRKVLKPRRSLGNNVIQEATSIKKCLFGVPDAQEVENLLHEQIKEDWDRIKERFGIDLEDIENMEVERLEAHTPRKRKGDPSKNRRSGNVKKRRLFQAQNSGTKTITDFFQVRKAAHPEKKQL